MEFYRGRQIVGLEPIFLFFDLKPQLIGLFWRLSSTGQIAIATLPPWAKRKKKYSVNWYQPETLPELFYEIVRGINDIFVSILEKFVRLAFPGIKLLIRNEKSPFSVLKSS